MRGFWGILAIGLCVTPALADDTPATPKERALIVAYMRSALLDPYSIRDAQITLVRRGNVPHVCVRMNAKNTYGGYTGIKSSLVYLNDDKPIERVHMDDPMGICPDLKGWSPFPELQAMK